ncbi:MAG: DUF6145 family protein [Eubacteriales bacterium]|nr:DUF6145 family protein [Eubacteriales bacterium]
MDMCENAGKGEKIVLCGANAYEQKYYFNRKFDRLPQSVKDELHIICVLFTREVGGVFLIVFEPDGTLAFETDAAEDDLLYDEISSGLLVGEIKRNRQELLESLTLYYRIFILGEDLSELTEESQ